MSAVAEVVCVRQCGADLGNTRGLPGERSERVQAGDDDVLVPADAFQPPSGEQERLTSDERAEVLVDRRCGDEVDEATLVLEQHEDDAVGGRRTLASDG